MNVVFSYSGRTSLYKNPINESVQLSNIVPYKSVEKKLKKPNAIESCTHCQCSLYKFNFRKQADFTFSYKFS